MFEIISIVKENIIKETQEHNEINVEWNRFKIEITNELNIEIQYIDKGNLIVF